VTNEPSTSQIKIIENQPRVELNRLEEMANRNESESDPVTNVRNLMTEHFASTGMDEEHARQVAVAVSNCHTEEGFDEAVRISGFPVSSLIQLRKQLVALYGEETTKEGFSHTDPASMSIRELDLLKARATTAPGSLAEYQIVDGDVCEIHDETVGSHQGSPPDAASSVSIEANMNTPIPPDVPRMSMRENMLRY